MGGGEEERHSTIIELSAQPWVSWIWGVSQPMRAGFSANREGAVWLPN